MRLVAGWWLMSVSTRRLSEVAKELVVPSGIVSTGWPPVRAKCAEFGVHFDGWQEGLGYAAFGKRANGVYAATSGGVVMSIPRQVGKTFFVGSIVVALCLLTPRLQVVWTAHHGRTATKTFQSLQSLVRRKAVAGHVLTIRVSNGEQEIRFMNGSVIYFGARSQGFGRGFDEIDVEVFDEAQILSEKALSDMIPAANQSRQPTRALVFFMGTPPRQSDPGEAFRAFRKRALSGKSKDVLYVECSADEGAKLDDRTQWAKANPSFPDRTPIESMERMREMLPSDDDWRREALGIWDDLESVSHIWDLEAWGRRVSDVVPSVPGAIGFAVSFDQAWASVGAASMVGDRPFLGAVVRKRRVREVALEAARISVEYGVPVAVDGRGPAAYLIPLLEEHGADVLVFDLGDVTAACADLTDRVGAGRVLHGGHTELDEAVLVATVRPIGDRFAWGRRGGDVSMLEAVTFAAYSVTSLAAGDPLAGIS